MAKEPATGAFTLAALGVFGFLTTDVKFRGMTDEHVLDEVMRRAHSHVIEEALLVLAVLMFVGALYGTLALLSGRAWDWARERTQPLYMRALRGVGFALLFHGIVLARSVVQYPQLYAAHYDYRVGWRRTIMRTLTDHVPPWLVSAVLVFALVAAILRPLLLPRGRMWARDQLQRTVSLARQSPRLAAAIVMPPAVLAVALSLFGGSTHPRTHGKPNVLIIAVDSLRADRLFAPDAQRFPALAELASRGVRFRQAYVSQARTFPSFVSMLTGRYPVHHGIRHEFPSATARSSIGPTLVTALRDAGWRTAAISDFSGDIFGRAPFGFSIVDAPPFDFDSVITQQMLSSQPHVLPYATTALGQRVFPPIRALAEFDDPALLADRAIETLDEVADDPFFMVVFFSSAHSPYSAPYPYYRAFADSDYDGVFRYLKQPLPAVPDLPPADTKQVRALYDGAVLAVDRSIARLLSALRDRGVADNTIIIVLGDHGENLYDLRGRGMGHGDHLWGPLDTHIPLVLIDPVPAKVTDVTSIVRDVDLAPTLARRLGVSLPTASDGVDLGPLLDGSKSTLELDAYSETGLWFLRSGPGYHHKERLPYPDIWNAVDAEPSGALSLKPQWEGPAVTAKYRAIRTLRWKLVYQPAPDGAHWRLFDVQTDPAERADVAADHPAEVAALRAKLEAWITADGATRIQPDAPR